MKLKLMGLTLGLLLSGAGLLFSPALAQANDPLTVNNNLADVPDAIPGDGACETLAGNGVCTLRAAVIEANARPGADTILIPAGVYELARPGKDNTAFNGDLDLSGEVTLQRTGPGQAIVDGNQTVTQAGVFHILSGATVSLSGLTIRNGQSEAPAAPGGVFNEGTLAMAQVTITDQPSSGFLNTGTAQLNQVTYTGNVGCLGNIGVLTITHSAILSNTTAGIRSCAGVGNFSGATLTVSDSTIRGNIAGASGGGLYIFNSAETRVINSTISGNSATLGSGAGIVIQNGALTRIVNSTISGNTAGGFGAGLSIFDDIAGGETALELFNVTLAHNKANADEDQVGNGGGLSSGYDSQAGAEPPVIRVRHSLIANNLRFEDLINGDFPDDCAGVVTSLGYNLLEMTLGCTVNGDLTGNLTGLDPNLGPLADNGGPTLSHALLPGSPAIDAADPAGCLDPAGAALSSDQRGYLRPADGGSGSARCDLGAFEFGALAPPPTPQPTPAPGPGGPQIYLPVVMN